MFAAHAARILRLAGSVWRVSGERHFSLIAAGVAFYAVFAVFPGMAATIAIWGLFADPLVVRDYLSLTQGILPKDVFLILETEMITLLAAKTKSTGWASMLTLGVSFYAVHNAVAALVNGLNATQSHSQVSAIGGLVKSFALTLVLVVIVLGALTTVVIVPVILNFAPLGPLNGLILGVLPWAVNFLAGLTMLGLFYRWGPNVTERRQSWVTPGACLAAVLWVLSSIAFSMYLANFGSYNRIYGSIGAVIALLMWLYMSAYIILLGAAVNSESARLGNQ